MSDRLDYALTRAIEAGLLPPTATRPGTVERPWPVVLLTALGAWLAAIPLAIALFLIIGGRHSGAYAVTGALLIVGAAAALRSGMPLFLEQLGFPVLVTGTVALGLGLADALSGRAMATVLALLTLTLAVLIPRPWLRALLGAAAAAFVAVVIAPNGLDHPRAAESWIAAHLLLALWWAAHWYQRRELGAGSTARAAVAIERIAAGWLLALLAGIALLAGPTFLAGGGAGGFAGQFAHGVGGHQGAAWYTGVEQAISAALALAAGAYAVRAWPSLRHPGALGGMAVLAVLAWFLPLLGAALLPLALTAVTHRFRLAGPATLAATWVIGSFYYQLRWDLQTKALVLAGLGLALGAVVWSARPRRSPPGPDRDATGDRSHRARWAIAASALATLAVVNVGIVQKEQLGATGRRVFVEIAPVDPRSLMQGDYMALNFGALNGLRSDLPPLATPERPRVVAKCDDRGVASLLRVHREAVPLAAGEFLIELTPKEGRWILVTDAWFFREGTGQRWQAAKFGEFRVAADGRALLVGMADRELRPITP